MTRAHVQMLTLDLYYIAKDSSCLDNQDALLNVYNLHKLLHSHVVHNIDHRLAYLDWQTFVYRSTYSVLCLPDLVAIL